MELVALIPLWYQYVLVGIFGLVIGSFLNVYLYRLHTGRSLAGGSHCLSCGTSLAWYELIPVLSYVALRGRCRSCTSYIPFRYMLVELLTAGVFLLEFYIYGLTASLPWFLLLLSILVVIAVYDLYHLIIPNELVVALGLVGLGVVVSLAPTHTLLELLPVLAWHLAAGLAASTFYASLWWYSKGRWIGFGDVKLALPLGFVLGTPAVFSFIVLSFWVGAVLSIAYLGLMQVVRRGQHSLPFYCVPITIKSEVPFAPFLIIAFLFVWWFDISVISLFTNIL